MLRVRSRLTFRFLADDESRRKFRRSWLVIRPWSGLIRRVWLRAIAWRAEGR